VCAAAALLIGLHPVVAIAGALVATLIELLPTGVDDNVTIPLISGLAMHLLISNWHF
jgi:dolichol kinase